MVGTPKESPGYNRRPHPGGNKLNSDRIKVSEKEKNGAGG